MGDADLVVRLDMPVPPSLPVGRGTAVLCLGACFHRHEPLRALELLVDGQPQRPTAWRMPRLDLFQALPPDLANSYRGGFWATLPIEARERPGTIEIEVAAELESGARVRAPLARIDIVEAPATPPAAERTGLVAVCMATFDPDMELFRVQVESLRAQTDTNWVCLISDDCSAPERFAEIAELVAGDPRFVVSRSERRLGYYRNFERALEMLPPEAELVALCDQDDRWYPEKLEVLRGALGDAAARLFGPAPRGPRRAHAARHAVEGAPQQPHQPRVAGCGEHRHRCRDAVSPRARGAGAALPGGAWMAVSRPLARRSWPSPVVTWPTSIARCTTTCSTAGRWSVRRRADDGGQRGTARAPREAGAPRTSTAICRARCSRRRCWRGARAGSRAASGAPFSASCRRTAPRSASPGSPLGRSAALAGHGETLGTESELARGILWRHLIRRRIGRREAPESSPYDASCPPLHAGTLGQDRLARWRAAV